MARLDDFLRGPHLRLPRPLDALSERWAGLRPRTRMLLGLAMVALLLLAVDVRARAADARWGGSPVPVLVATSDVPVGAEATALRRRFLPPEAVPPGAVADVPEGRTMAFALPAGSVLTAAHLQRRGPAAGLEPGLRAVPVPVEEAWGVEAGGWVDVWVLGAGAEASSLVAAARPVLQVLRTDTGTSALVGLAADEVGPVSAGFAIGNVLLAHAPPPGER